MPRITVTLDDDIMKILRQIQGSYIADTGEDWSFTTIVNMVLLGGLVGVKKFKKQEWKTINEFLDEKKFNLELESPLDIIANYKLQMEEKEDDNDEDDFDAEDDYDD